MIANATKKHRCRGGDVDCISKGDPYRVLGAAAFIVYYLHKYRNDDIRPVSIDDVWEGGDDFWPHVPLDPPYTESEAWEKRSPQRELVSELVDAGVLTRVQNRHSDRPLYGHVDGIRRWGEILRKQLDTELQYFPFDTHVVPEFDLDPCWRPETKLWFLDETDEVKISLNSFTRGKLSAVMTDGRGCSVATHRMFPRWSRRHRVAVVHTDEAWPFEEGGWDDLERYADFTMREIHTLIENKTLIIRPDSVGSPIGPDDLVHLGHKDSIGLIP